MKKQAIAAPRQNLFLVPPEDLVLIGRDTKDSPAHPRYDIRVHNKFEEDVVQGMMEFGVQEAIKVVKNGEALEVVDGRQRTINAREANRRLREAGAPEIRVRVIIVRGEAHRLAAIGVILNEHRVDDSPLGRGQKAQNLLDMGHPLDAVARYFKVSTQSINNYTSLLGLMPEIRDMLIAGTLPATKGYELAQKGTSAQKTFLARKNEPKVKRTRTPKAPVLSANIEKVLESGEGKLSKEFLLGVRFALGMVSESDIPAVAALLAPSPFEVVTPKSQKARLLA